MSSPDRLTIRDNYSPVAQNELYFGTPKAMYIKDRMFFPTGMLHICPIYYQLKITWAGLQPPVDQRPIFDNVLLTREPVPQFVPESTIVQWQEHSSDVQLRWLNAHWRSRPAGTDYISGLRWYITYGTDGECIGTQFLDIIDQASSISYDFQDVDSMGEDSSGVIDVPPAYKGWTLLLLRQFFTLPDNSGGTGGTGDSGGADAPPISNIHIYGGWTLSDPNLDPATVYSPKLYNPLIEQEWFIFHNPLLFPQHTMKTKPFLS